MKKNNKLLNHQGFSLVEILMVVGLMGIVTLGSMNFMVDMVKSTNSVTSRQDVAMLVNILQNQLLSSSSCRQGISPTQTFDLQKAAIKSDSGGKGMPVTWAFSPTETLNNGSSLTSYELDIERLEFYDGEFTGNVGPNRQYLANLVGVFKARKKVSGTGIFGRRLGQLYLEVNPGNQIVDCYSVTGPDNASVDRICQAMGLPIIEETQTCDLDSLMQKTMVQVCSELGKNVHPNGKKCDDRGNKK